MTQRAAFRILSGSGASGSAPRLEAGNTTERGQDKRAHIALRSVGCFCWLFSDFSHLAAHDGNVRRRRKSLNIKDLSHIAGLRHGR